VAVAGEHGDALEPGHCVRIQKALHAIGIEAKIVQCGPAWQKRFFNLAEAIGEYDQGWASRRTVAMRAHIQVHAQDEGVARIKIGQFS
jgi:hypothetical protein